MNPIRNSLILFILIATAGCGDRQPATDEPPSRSPDLSATAWQATEETDLKNFTVAISPVEGSIERNRHFSLDVSIAPTDSGKSIGEDFTVTVDADMPAHQHGMNTRPETTKTADHTYRVDGMLFHMGGDWVITVKIDRGKETEQAHFPVSIE